MNKSKILANRFREVTLNGTWIANTNFVDQLTSTSIIEANTQINNLNTIALLTQHINYYIKGIINVFKNGTLDIKDKYSFDFKPIESEKEWNAFKLNFKQDSELLAKYIEELSEEKLDIVFVEPEYGTYERNIDGMIEHCYYHLGQISLIKKMITSYRY
jgi:hypothetical protein